MGPLRPAAHAIALETQSLDSSDGIGIPALDPGVQAAHRKWVKAASSGMTDARGCCMNASARQKRTVDIAASLEVTDHALRALRSEPQTPAIVGLAAKIRAQREELYAQLDRT